jgi:septum formation topological specificity factor MinE
METAKLKKFAQFARRSLLEQASAKLKLVLAENSAARRENPKAVAEIEKQIFGEAGKYTDNCTLTTDHSHRRAQLSIASPTSGSTASAPCGSWM